MSKIFIGGGDNGLVAVEVIPIKNIYLSEGGIGGGGSGTVTSVAVTGSDGIQVDSGSPITGAGTITLGVDASALRTHLNVGQIGSFVDLTTNQTIAGQKSFSSSLKTDAAIFLQSNVVVSEINDFASINYNSAGQRFKFKPPLNDSPTFAFDILLSGLTANVALDVPTESGKLAITEDLFTDFEPSTGNILFSPLNGKPRKYGFTTALTGNVVFETTGAKETIMVKAKWNAGTLPTVSVVGGGVTLIKSGDFTISVDNYIEAICHKNDAGTVTAISYSIMKA